MSLTNTLTQLKPQLDDIIRFNQLMGREVGNPAHIQLQRDLLRSELEEWRDAEIVVDQVDGMCDAIVCAYGGLYLLSEFDPFRLLVGYAEFYEHDSLSFSDMLSSTMLPFPICFAVQSALDADVDIYRALHEVNQSNFSKFCTSTEIKPTIDKYQALGVTLRFEQIEEGLSAAYVESSTDAVKYPVGKLMKSVGYREPDLGWVTA